MGGIVFGGGGGGGVQGVKKIIGRGSSLMSSSHFGKPWV